MFHYMYEKIMFSLYMKVCHVKLNLIKVKYISIDKSDVL
jgi:hypothetical protein